MPQLEFPDSLKSSDSFLGTQFTPNIPVQNHVTFLDQWPCHSMPSSSYPLIPPRLRSQDAWDPLHLAAQTGALSFQPRNSIYPQYSSFSEQDSKYNYSHSPGSTYSGKGDTTSSAATSFADSGYSSQSGPSEEQVESPSALEQNPKYTNKPVDPIEMHDPSAIPDPEMNCNYPGCNWTGKCPSDKRCV